MLNMDHVKTVAAHNLRAFYGVQVTADEIATGSFQDDSDLSEALGCDVRYCQVLTAFVASKLGFEASEIAEGMNADTEQVAELLQAGKRLMDVAIVFQSTIATAADVIESSIMNARGEGLDEPEDAGLARMLGFDVRAPVHA